MCSIAYTQVCLSGIIPHVHHAVMYRKFIVANYNSVTNKEHAPIAKLAYSDLMCTGSVGTSAEIHFASNLCIKPWT